MITFDNDAFKKVVLDLTSKSITEEDMQLVILFYIIYANNSEINELSEYSDQLSRL
jgi:hypothetical protein